MPKKVPGPPRWHSGKESAVLKTWVQPLGQEDPLEEETTSHSTVLAWRIPWTEEPGKLVIARTESYMTEST